MTIISHNHQSRFTLLHSKLCAVAIVMIGAALDLASKAWARASLEPYGDASDFLPFVSLRLTFNEGVSFSMFAFEGNAGLFFLLGLTGILTLVMAVWTYFSKGWQRTGLSAVTAGALGNLIDRSTRGAVTDFLDLHFAEWHPFVFNLADIWISAGFCILIAAPFLQKNRLLLN